MKDTKCPVNDFEHYTRVWLRVVTNTCWLNDLKNKWQVMPSEFDDCLQRWFCHHRRFSYLTAGPLVLKGTESIKDRWG